MLQKLLCKLIWDDRATAHVMAHVEATSMLLILGSCQMLVSSSTLTSASTELPHASGFRWVALTMSRGPSTWTDATSFAHRSSVDRSVRHLEISTSVIRPVQTTCSEALMMPRAAMSYAIGTRFTGPIHLLLIRNDSDCNGSYREETPNQDRTLVPEARHSVMTESHGHLVFGSAPKDEGRHQHTIVTTFNQDQL